MKRNHRFSFFIFFVIIFFCFFYVLKLCDLIECVHSGISANIKICSNSVTNKQTTLEIKKNSEWLYIFFGLAKGPSFQLEKEKQNSSSQCQ